MQKYGDAFSKSSNENQWNNPCAAGIDSNQQPLGHESGGHYGASEIFICMCVFKYI